MIKNILVLFMMVLFFGCTKKLKESERNWNPYTLNEVLVFESSEEELDTIVIHKIIEDAIASGPAPKLYRETYLTVYRELKLNENQFARTDILGISSSTPKEPATIGFPLYFENANFSGWGFKLKELEKYPTMSVTTKALQSLRTF